MIAILYDCVLWVSPCYQYFTNMKWKEVVCDIEEKHFSVRVQYPHLTLAIMKSQRPHGAFAGVPPRGEMFANQNSTWIYPWSAFPKNMDCITRITTVKHLVPSPSHLQRSSRFEGKSQVLLLCHLGILLRFLFFKICSHGKFLIQLLVRCQQVNWHRKCGPKAVFRFGSWWEWWLPMAIHDIKKCLAWVRYDWAQSFGWATSNLPWHARTSMWQARFWRHKILKSQNRHQIRMRISGKTSNFWVLWIPRPNRHMPPLRVNFENAMFWVLMPQFCGCARQWCRWQWPGKTSMDLMT